jgi:hypothetical protein
MDRMAGDLSGTGCPAVCQEKDVRRFIRNSMSSGLEQELSVNETKILWSVRSKIADDLSVRRFFWRMPGGLSWTRGVRSANAYLLFDDIN